MVSFNQIIPVLKKQMSKFKKASKRIPKDKAPEVLEELTSIREVIVRDLNLASGNNLALLDNFIEILNNIFFRLEECNLDFIKFFGYVVEDFTKAYIISRNKDKKEYMVKFFLERIEELTLDVFDSIFPLLNEALEENGVRFFETALKEKPDSLKYKKILADLHDDVDEYIQIVKSNPNINDMDKIGIVRRLTKRQRYQEALEWIGLMSTLGEYEEARCMMEIEIQQDLGNKKRCLDLNWLLFEKNLELRFFDKLAELSDDQKALQLRAVEVAMRHQNVGEAMKLFLRLQDISLLKEFIVKRFEVLQKREFNFKLAFSIVLEIMPNDKFVAAILCRAIILNILENNNVKLFDFAARVFAAYSKIAENVPNWQNFPVHTVFFNKLNTIHGRKTSFWRVFWNLPEYKNVFEII